MQAYTGNRNKVALSKSTDLQKMFPCWSKMFSRNIKKVVRQEGRKDCIFGSDVASPEEIAYQKKIDFLETVAAIVQNQYENPDEHDQFCRDEENRIRKEYNDSLDVIWEFERALWNSGIAPTVRDYYYDYYED